MGALRGRCGVVTDTDYNDLERWRRSNPLAMDATGVEMREHSAAFHHLHQRLAKRRGDDRSLRRHRLLGYEQRLAAWTLRRREDARLAAVVW